MREESLTGAWQREGKAQQSRGRKRVLPSSPQGAAANVVQAELVAAVLLLRCEVIQHTGRGLRRT